MHLKNNNNNIGKAMYSLELIEDWADGDEQWLRGFLELFLKEIPTKLELLTEAVDLSDSKKIAYELHQLSSQLALLGNVDLNNMITDFEKKAMKNCPVDNIDILIQKATVMLNQLKCDFKM